MSFRKFFIFIITILFFSLFLPSCLKTESSVCKTDTDCDKDEKCCSDAISGASTISKEGTCKTSCNDDVIDDDEVSN